MTGFSAFLQHTLTTPGASARREENKKSRPSFFSLKKKRRWRRDETFASDVTESDIPISWCVCVRACELWRAREKERVCVRPLMEDLRARITEPGTWENGAFLCICRSQKLKPHYPCTLEASRRGRRRSRRQQFYQFFDNFFPVEKNG